MNFNINIFKNMMRAEKKQSVLFCLDYFVGTDIIKAFYKCNHILHKKCLLSWLKKNNTCPFCKHDLSEDIKAMK